jgi:hypothetical protein
MGDKPVFFATAGGFLASKRLESVGSMASIQHQRHEKNCFSGNSIWSLQHTHFPITLRDMFFLVLTI